MQKSALENAIEFEGHLLELLIGKQVTISRPRLAEITGMSLRSISRRSKFLEATERWEITRGTGRNETTFRLITGE